MKNLDSILTVSDEGLYPIRTVSEISGVNSITLRAWERRHNLFNPKRTPKGHRLYSDKDIQRIHQVLALLAKGLSIGRVAHALKEDGAEERFANLISVQTEENNYRKLPKAEWKKYQHVLLTRISTYNVIELENFHHDLLSQYPIEIVIDNLILPTLKILDNKAKQLKSLSGEYHFYKAFILNRIGGLFLKSSIQNSGKRLLLVGLTKAQCDVELLLFAMPLIQYGYQVIILGCDISLDAIPISLSSSKAEGLLIYSDASTLTDSSSSAFDTIVNSLNTPVFIAGCYNNIEEKSLKQSPLIVLPNKLKKQLEMINKNLNKNLN